MVLQWLDSKLVCCIAGQFTARSRMQLEVKNLATAFNPIHFLLVALAK